MSTTWIPPPACVRASTRTSATRSRSRAGIAKITIDRPEVRNAFRPRTMVEISAALEHAREDTEVGVIVLTGEGADGVLLRRGPAGARRHRLPRRGRAGSGVGRFHVTDLHVQIRRLPKPVVAMVAGYAIGGGHVLHVVLRPDDRRRQRAALARSDRGSAPSTAASARACCANLVGTKKAKEIWLLCRQYDAEEALAMGLVNTVVPLERLESGDDRLVPRDARPLPLRPATGEGELQRRTRTGYAGIQQLAHDANLLFYGSEEARRDATRSRRSAARTSRRFPAPAMSAAHLGDGRRPRTCRPRSHPSVGTAAAVRGAGALPGAGLRGRAARQRVHPGRAPICQTTIPTPAAEPTPPIGSVRCGSPRPGWSSAAGADGHLGDIWRSPCACGIYLVVSPG